MVYSSMRTVSPSGGTSTLFFSQVALEVRVGFGPSMPMGSLGMGYDPEAEYTVYTFDGYADTQPGVFLETGKK